MGWVWGVIIKATKVEIDVTVTAGIAGKFRNGPRMPILTEREDVRLVEKDGGKRGWIRT
jgi:hypothetical protein